MLARLAGRQHGVVGRRQLLVGGVTRDEIAHRLATGALLPLHRGVYAVGHTALPPLGRAMAALLACGPGSALSFFTAAVLWALLPDRPGPIHVSRAGPRRDGRPGIVVHEVGSLDIIHRHGLAVTTPLRTLLDLAAAAATDRDLTSAVTEARVRNLVDDAALLAAATGRPGAGRLRELLATEPALTRSEAERRLLDLIGRAGLPRPLTNVRVGRFEADAHWPHHHLVVEVDGYAYHGHRTAFERDRGRDAELTAAGHRVLRLTGRQLTREPEAVIARLAEALAR